jgi:hypothetical protein
VGGVQGDRDAAPVAARAQARADGVAQGTALRENGEAEQVTAERLDPGEGALGRRGVGDGVVEAAEVVEGVRREDVPMRHGRPSGGRRGARRAPRLPHRQSANLRAEIVGGWAHRVLPGAIEVLVGTMLPGRPVRVAFRLHCPAGQQGTAMVLGAAARRAAPGTGEAVKAGPAEAALTLARGPENKCPSRATSACPSRC